MRVSRLDKLFLTKHLATMIKAGVPLSEALNTVSEQATPDLATLLKKIEEDVENGMNLATSMKKYPKVFDTFYVSLIAAGEASGTLEENLRFLAIQLNKDYILSKKISGALFYPGLVISATVIMGTIISWFVLPQLADLFTSFDVALPLSTRILLGFAALMKNYGGLIIFGMIGLVFLLVFILRIKPIRYLFDSWIIKWPFVGKIVVDGEMARFSRNLGTLLSSGIPVVNAMEITRDTLSNLRFKKDLKEIIEKVSEGKNISLAMDTKKHSEFSRMSTKMVEVGEKTGKLDEILIYLSDYYEEEIEDVSKNLSNILEPILLLIIGVVVAFVALAIITPIYSLIGGIK
ncbi:MAG TPA: type II secretion system F family protein [Patescibacteria group bacterium]